jgi:hypothetical protein
MVPGQAARLLEAARLPPVPTRRIAFDEWNGEGDDGTLDEREEAFKTGWLAALAQIVGMFEVGRQHEKGRT